MTWQRASGSERCGYCGLAVARNDLLIVLETRRVRCCGCVARHHPGAPATPTDLPLLREPSAIDASVFAAQIKRVVTKPYHRVGEVAKQMGFRDVKAAQCGDTE